MTQHCTLWGASRGRFHILWKLEMNFFLFINVNQLDALNFYKKFISSLYMFRAHVLIVRRAKILLYSLWYHHTETSERSKITKIIKIIKNTIV